MGWAQSVISGRVKTASGATLPQATVRVVEQNLVVSTNNEGAFTVPQVKNGEVTVQVSFLGYKTASEKVTLLNETKVMEVARRAAP